MSVEPGLGESADPAELVVADLPAIDGAVGRLCAMSAALARAGRGLRGIETGEWSGEAADAFRARFDESPARWLAGADAFAEAATACDAFRRSVHRSREQAARAVELYRSGVRASEAAVRDRAAAVADLDARLAAAAASEGPAPDPLPGFTDPGVPIMEQAAAVLDAARRERDAAGAGAARIVHAAAVSAPEPPTGLARSGAEAADLLAEGDRYLAGLGEGVAGIVESAQALNPLNPANVLHPASYVENLSSTAAGAVRAAVHPAEMVTSAVGTGWGSDPAAALGRLVPNLALSVLTGGAGKALGRAGRGAPSAHRPPEPARVAADVAGGDAPDTRRPPPKTEDSPDLPARATLNWPFADEQYGRSFAFPGRAVEYFDDARRERSRLTVRDGLLYDSDGDPFDTSDGATFWSPEEPMAMFVMDPKGNLYASLEQDVGRIHHSSLSAGEPVAGAGEISVVDGRVVEISEESGHYTPPPECLDQVMDYLRNEGLDLDGTEVRRHGD